MIQALSLLQFRMVQQWDAVTDLINPSYLSTEIGMVAWKIEDPVTKTLWAGRYHALELTER